MNTNNIIIAKDRKNKILRFTGIEDWYDVLKEFRECMSRNNHAGVLSENDYDEPVEPVAALNRLRNTSRVPPLPTDQRDKTDFVKAMKSWTSSCTAVLCSLINILSIEVSSRLEATDIDLTRATRQNIYRIIDWLNQEYGGWSDARGTRNYDEMLRIPNFTSIETTNEGFRKLKLLTDERNGWRDPNQRYTDAFYKNWLLLRMEDWPKLDFERNLIQGAPHMPFAAAKVRVLAVIKAVQDKIYLSNSRQYTSEKVTDVQPNIDMDSIAQNFQSNMIQRTTSPRPSIQANTWTERRCYNCGLTTHSQHQCNEPWCSRCKQTWASIKDANYHRPHQCPTVQTSNTTAAKPTMQTHKRPLESGTQGYQTTQRPMKQPYRPRQPFPPRGTMPPRPLKTTATAYTTGYDDVDYNDIQSLRAFAIRAQSQQHYEDEDEQQHLTEQAVMNPQDADWDPDQQS